MVTVIFVLAAAARLSQDGKLASWLNASTLLSQALAPFFFGMMLTNHSFPNLLPYLMVLTCLSLFCIFLTKNQLDK